MPCNAVATARAKVNVDAVVLQNITAEMAAKIIAAAYNQIDCYACQMSTYAGVASIYTKNLVVTYNSKTGDIEASARMYGSEKMIDDAIQIIPAILRRAAAAIIQQRVKEILKTSGAHIEGEQVTPTGAMILTVDM